MISHISISLRTTFPQRRAEWALGVVIFLWGVILLNNETLFSDGISYSEIARTASQETWGAICLALGLVRLLVLLINGAWRRSPHARALVAFLSCFFWFQVSMGMAAAGTWSTGLAVYPVFLILDALNVIFALGEAGRSDAHYKRTAAHGSPQPIS